MAAIIGLVAILGILILIVGGVLLVVSLVNASKKEGGPAAAVPHGEPGTAWNQSPHQPGRPSQWPQRPR